MKKITGLLICILMLQHFSATAQSFAINSTGAAAHASAILDVTSTTKGLLIPRMTKTERNNIVAPATGLMIFQTGPDSIGFHYYNGSSWSWISSSNGSDWKLTGNAGTNPATNFIGTSDNQPLRFRLNNIWAGEINATTGCVSLGQNSLPNNAGVTNVAIGSQSMRTNNTGSWNTAVGSNTLYYNYDGMYNTALGYYALSENFSGDNNTATGLNAMQKNTNGSYNSAYGYFSLFENRTGNYNTAVGSSALKTNKYGSNNTAIGDSADVRDSSFNHATAIGAKSAVNCSYCLVLGSVNGTNGATSNVNVGIGTTTPQALLHVKRGAVLFDSTIGSTPVSGAGTRMMWIPAKAAFRAGTVLGSEWDDTNTGINSTAMGFNTLASNYSSTAIGNSSTASGVASVALGVFLLASGNNSLALGYSNTSSADRSTSIGSFNKSSGVISFSSGYFTKSKSFSGFTTGTFNDSANAADPNNFNTLNRIFEIGNGTADNARSNAMTVLQNGNIGIGEVNPTVPLNFASTLGNKIALWGNGSNHYGLGIQPSLLQLYTMDAGNDIAFGYGSSAALTENVRFKGNGNVGVGTNNPNAKLNITGSETTPNGLAVGLQLTNTASANSWTLRAGATGTNTPPGGFSIGDNAAYRFVITSIGNVGIGNTAPTATLDVTGTTTTDGLQVSNGTVFTKMQSGSATVGSSATAQKIITIIFPVGFASATPKVFATARNEPASSFTDAFSVSVRSITATSVTLNVQRTDSITGWGQQLVVDWFAVE